MGSLLVKLEEGRREKSRRKWESWMGWFMGVAAEAGGWPSPFPATLTAWRLVLSVHKHHCPQEKALLWFLPITSFATVLSAARIPNKISSPPAPLPPILHQYIWHIPMLIVQAEPLALFRICIRMLFLYNSKQRHVEPLLNCSANRRRF